jgi:hypothetical protein
VYDVPIEGRPLVVGASPDGETIAACCKSRVVVMRARNGAVLCERAASSLPLEWDRLHTIRVSNDGARVLIGRGHHHFSRTGTQALYWNVRTDTCQDLPGFAEVRYVAFDATGRFGAVESRGPRAALFDLDTCEALWRGRVRPLFSDDGKHALITGDEGTTIRAAPFRDDRGTPIQRPPHAAAIGVATGGDVAVCALQGTVLFVRGTTEVLRIEHGGDRDYLGWHAGVFLVRRRRTEPRVVELLELFHYGERSPRATVVLEDYSPVWPVQAICETCIVFHRAGALHVWPYRELRGEVVAYEAVAS